MRKFKRKYRSDSLRLQGHDYASEGLYFLTICTKRHFPYFGSINKGVMQLNEAGSIVANEWQKTAEIREEVQLGEWVVMPNHIHGIVALQAESSSGTRRDASHASHSPTSHAARQPKASQRSGTGASHSPHQGLDTQSTDSVRANDLQGDGRGPSLPGQSYKNEFGPQRNNISAIVRGFKSACTKNIRKSGVVDFHWQPGFYDHIIRNQKSLLRIENYIIENPYRWCDDKYHCQMEHGLHRSDRYIRVLKNPC